MSFVKNLFASISTKLTLIMLAMGAMTAAAVLVAYLIFQSIGANLHVMAEKNVPKMQNATKVILAAGDLKDGLTEILLAKDDAELRENESLMTTTFQDAITLIRSLDNDIKTQMLPDLEAVEKDIHELVDARSSEFSNLATMRVSTQSLKDLSVAVRKQIDTMMQAAFFNLVLGSKDTIRTVNKTLTKLIDKDFKALQITLQIRAELNLLSGVSLAKFETTDPEMGTVLSDISQSSIRQLTDLMAQAAEHERTKSYVPALNETFDFFKKINASGYYFTHQTSIQSMSVRKSSDALLAAAVEDFISAISFDVAETSDKNKASIKSLLDTEVKRIRDLAVLSSEIDAVIALTLRGAASPDEVAMTDVQVKLTGAIKKLLGRMDVAGPNLAASIKKLVSEGDPKTGMIALARNVLQSRASAAEVAHNAAKDVHKMSEHAANYGAIAIADFKALSGVLEGEISQANSNLKIISIASVALFLLTQLISYLSIIRPLGRVTKRTETLAKGDLTPAPELDRYRGEIGRLARALAVFREGLAQKIEMEKEEETQRIRRQEEVAKAAEDKQALERREQEMLEEAARKQQAVKDEQHHEREEMRKKAEEESQKHKAEQDLVVNALAEGLKKLASGNLDAVIEGEFAQGYEQLRLDFNDAIQTLDQVILRISESTEIISSESTSLSHAAEDLSKRTENSASALEETASALELLTVSVNAASDGASSANQVVKMASDNAVKSEEVVRNTVLAMSKIATSSEEISKIISVIDDIAFQTNLLALNAGVEAARAGESGRGFAVVASEVRALAQRSSEAAHQITELILGSGDQVKTGVKLVDQTGSALKEIISSVGEISSHVSEIAASAKEQSTGLSEINTAMSRLDRATQQNVAMFEETTAANQALARETHVLSNAVNVFSPSTPEADILVYPTEDDQATAMG